MINHRNEDMKNINITNNKISCMQEFLQTCHSLLLYYLLGYLVLLWSSTLKRMNSLIQTIIFCLVMLSFAGGIEGNTTSTGEA